MQTTSSTLHSRRAPSRAPSRWTAPAPFIRRPFCCHAFSTAHQEKRLLPEELAAATGHESRSIGAMLGAMCGSVLGAPFEHDRHYRITRMHPSGVHDYWHFDLAQKPVPYGHYTGDFADMLAVAQSLSSSGTASLFHIAGMLAASYEEGGSRRYNPYAELILQSLRTTPDLHTLPQLAHDFQLHTSQRPAQSSSNRPEREPWGWADHGAAVRVAPIGLAYRNAPLGVLRQAVHCSLLFSHSHELGRDGALVQAAAAAYLSRLDPSDEAASHPSLLLEHLLEVAQSQDMRSKLKLMLRGLLQLGEVRDYTAFWGSQQWHEVCRMANWLTYQNQATVGTEAAAVALWCLCTSWGQPRQAVSMAVHLGGSTPATACMTGALAGALHGCSWLPGSWYSDLENGVGGRDEVVAAAKGLALLDCSHVAPLNPSLDEADAMVQQLQQQFEADAADFKRRSEELQKQQELEGTAAAERG